MDKGTLVCLNYVMYNLKPMAQRQSMCSGWKSKGKGKETFKVKTSITYCSKKMCDAWSCELVSLKKVTITITLSLFCLLAWHHCSADRARGGLSTVYEKRINSLLFSSLRFMLKSHLGGFCSFVCPSSKTGLIILTWTRSFPNFCSTFHKNPEGILFILILLLNWQNLIITVTLVHLLVLSENKSPWCQTGVFQRIWYSGKTEKKNPADHI